MNPWEEPALEEYDASAARGGAISMQPNIFHSGLYTGSGVDAISILLEMYNRPNPQVYTGPIDAACPLIICDLSKSDCPIIYASDAFAMLTGYSKTEVLGYNCRFLQTPPPGKAAARKSSADKDALKKIRHAVGHNRECQVMITNYRRDGTKFLNYLTIIPVRWNSNEFNYSVGLQNVAPES